VERGDCLWINRVETYTPSRVGGVVTRLRIDPSDGVIELAISDGISSLAAQWPIRPPVDVLKAIPGVGLILEGIARIGPRGELLMVEPTFEILPGPEQQ